MVKRRLPPHIVLPDGRWRFVKRGSTATKKRRMVRTMARYRRRRSYGRIRRYASRSRSWAGGRGSVTKNAIDGVIVGVAQSALPDVIPFQDPLIALGVGWWRKNPTLVTLGGIQVGAALGGMVGGGLKLGGGSSQVG